MLEAEREFLNRLLESPSPSGYETPVQDQVRGFCEPFCDRVQTDWLGNVMAAVNPGGSPRIMLDGHCDQIGLLVKHIDDSGFLRVSAIGGWDPQMLVGQRMQVWTEDGPVCGAIARKPIHLLTQDERKKIPEIKDLWIDIGASDRTQAAERVRIGDPVTLELGSRALGNGLLCGPGMDNRVGVWVVMSALKLIADREPQAEVVAVSSVQEEVGLRGARTSAFNIDPHLGIAVDVTHATDCPTIDCNEHGEIRLGKGPVLVRGPNANPVMFQRICELAEQHEVPLQINALSKPAANDGNAIQVSRAGVATAIVAIPNRYMHSPVEVVSLDDLQHAAQIIAEFCVAVDEQSDFTP